MSVETQTASIVYQQGGMTIEVVFEAGRQEGEVSAIALQQKPVHYAPLKLKTKPGQDEDAIAPDSGVSWKEAREKGIRGLKVSADTQSGKSGEALCFETRRGWYCVE